MLGRHVVGVLDVAHGRVNDLFGVRSGGVEGFVGRVRSEIYVLGLLWGRVEGE